MKLLRAHLGFPLTLLLGMYLLPAWLILDAIDRRRRSRA